jgi:hypothetical protein
MQRKGGFLLSYIFLKKYLLYGEALRVHSIFPAKRLIQSEKLNSVPARWPEPNAGVARHVGGSHAYAEAPADRHIWLLISASGRIKIFGSFVSSIQYLQTTNPAK